MIIKCGESVRDARLELSAVRIDGNSQLRIEAVRKRRADCMSVERTCCSLVDMVDKLV